jgi:hypothetical protein
MEQINLSLMSDSEDKTVTKVNLNATFANREQATAFHAKVAALCEHAQRHHNAGAITPVWHPRSLLGRS